MFSEFYQQFAPIWNWQRVSQKALDELESSLRHRWEMHDDSEAHAELEQLRPCREELENFAVLSLWAVFEETLNTWLAQRTHWAGASSGDDQEIRKGLLRRIQYWGIAEKIDCLKPVLGLETIQNLHDVRRWRDWVAHRKTGPRPRAVDLEMAQSLLISALIRLKMRSDEVLNALA